MERVKTGVPNLDALLAGGLPRGSATLVKGGPGAGKTALGLQWVCRGAADFGEPGAIIVLEETPQQFYGRAHAFGWDLRRLEEQNKVRIIFTSAETLSHDILTNSLLVGMLAEIGVRRVVIDPISQYRLVYQDERQLRQQVAATVNALKRLGQTCLLTADLDPKFGDPAPEEYLADTVVCLTDSPVGVSGFRRLEISKSSSHDHHPRSALFRIVPAGLHIVTPFYRAPSQAFEALPALLPSLFEEIRNERMPGGFCLIQVETNLRRCLLDLALMTSGGTSTAVYCGHSGVNPSELWNVAESTGLSRSIAGENAEQRTHIVEYLGRQSPPSFPSEQFTSIDGIGCESFLSILRGSERAGHSASTLPPNARIICDISDIFYQLGYVNFRTFLPRLVDVVKSRHSALMGVVDPRVMNPESNAWVQGIADVIWRLWEIEGGRFAQVVKSPKRAGFLPRLLVETDHPPFFELID